jgi:hypothetical protein
MRRKHPAALLAVATLSIAAGGCLSNKTTSGITPHKLKVVDAVTKLPVAGADVKLSAPGMTMGNRTDERGIIDIGAYGFYSIPRPEEVEVVMQGYNRVSFRLTNGLPHTLEITPVQGQE